MNLSLKPDKKSSEVLSMGMLDRYKKTGGFVQLVSLIESLTPAKQEKFLTMIQEEDPIWMEAVKQRMLSVDKIFSWSNDTVSEIVRRLPTKSLASALKGLRPEYKEKAICLMSNSEKRKLEDESSALSEKPEEAQANVLKLIELTRKMIQETDLRLDMIAPALIIEEGIEGKLAAKGSPAKVVVKEESMPTSVPQLQKMVNTLIDENRKLKTELKLLKDKFEQIKKAS